MSFTIAIPPEWGPYINIEVGAPGAENRNITGLDYARYTPTTAKLLSSTPVAGNALPAGAEFAIISVLTNAIRFRTGGTSPTASEGTILPVGAHIFSNRLVLEQFRFIDSAAGASEVTVQYFRRV